MPHFTIEMLPAQEGDALLVEWGADGPNHRILIDGGRGGRALNGQLTAAFERLSVDQRHFELVVCSHMDADHIAGLLGLFGQPPEGFSVGEVWFNAFRHLPQDDLDVLGWEQSDRLEVLVDEFVADHPDTAWNDTFGGGGAIVVPDQPTVDPLPSVSIEGLTITLVSPTLERLRSVAKEWPEAVRRERLGLEPGEDDSESDGDGGDVLGFDEDKGVEPSELAERAYKPDKRAPNGSSIAFIVEFAQKRVLFGADAHAEVLVDTLRRWQPEGTIAFDAVKLSHHCSEKNLSPELLELIDAPTWLVSTNGSSHHHPDRRAIARLITRGVPTNLVFNYRSDETDEWGKASRQDSYGFTAYLPPRDKPGVRYDVVSDEASPLL